MPFLKNEFSKISEDFFYDAVIYKDGLYNISYIYDHIKNYKLKLYMIYNISEVDVGSKWSLENQSNLKRLKSSFRQRGS